MKDIESIHESTLKAVLTNVIEDNPNLNPADLSKAIVHKLFGDGMGRYGKIGHLRGHNEFYSQYAALDFPFEMGGQLFILEG